MDELLEAAVHPTSEPRGVAMAIIALGPAFAAVGKLHREMELHPGESDAPRVGRQARGLAVSGNAKRPPLVAPGGRPSGGRASPRAVTFAIRVYS